MHPFLIAYIFKNAIGKSTVRAMMFGGLFIFVFAVFFPAGITFEASLIFVFELRGIAIFMDGEFAKLALERLKLFCIPEAASANRAYILRGIDLFLHFFFFALHDYGEYNYN